MEIEIIPKDLEELGTLLGEGPCQMSRPCWKQPADVTITRGELTGDVGVMTKVTTSPLPLTALRSDTQFRMPDGRVLKMPEAASSLFIAPPINALVETRCLDCHGRGWVPGVMRQDAPLNAKISCSICEGKGVTF